ncbi:hypothetical protein BQ8482_20104 [Mesorhizobium delmotii]|uniref:Uncharacterized protein n=1 Tax=Mesorhizobium delmotii TaxID=1631247 RepID=A0A2P9AK11_9HYPH|nr:hypothetical protein BQ8482_20104 [Mesorhizobium delmotii]
MDKVCSPQKALVRCRASGNRRRVREVRALSLRRLPVCCRKVYACPSDSHTGRVGKQHFLEFMLLYYKSIAGVSGAPKLPISPQVGEMSAGQRGALSRRRPERFRSTAAFGRNMPPRVSAPSWEGSSPNAPAKPVTDQSVSTG